MSQSVKRIVDAIRRLSPTEKEELAKALDADGSLLGPEYGVLPRSVVELMSRSQQAGHAREVELGRALVPLANEAVRRRRGPTNKHERLKRRNEIIDGLVEQGMTDPEDIFRFLQVHHPDLVKKGRGHIDPDQMMATYRRRDRG
jgi:hypothetical protein